MGRIRSPRKPISSEMTRGTRRKLTPALVSLCPNSKKEFVQQGYPRIFCCKNCRQNTWKRQQAKYLEAGRKAVAEMAAQGRFLHFVQISVGFPIAKKGLSGEVPICFGSLVV
jgi:hypothetical protein